VLNFEGPFDGFALSPDGSLALASGRSDGVWRASTQSLQFEQLSCAKLRCLSWSAAGLFACADEFEAGFLVGESTDSGLSFAPSLHLSCVRGPLSCATDSSVGGVCPAAWPAISEQLGTDCSSAGSFTPGTVCSTGSDDDSAGNADAGAGNARDAALYSPHGGCSLGPAPALAQPWLAVLGLSLAFARRHARHITRDARRRSIARASRKS
jgi:hypothetical protein